MASVDSEGEAMQAQRRGWRTFRVSADGERMAGEMTCPASEEAGKVMNCAECKACGGNEGVSMFPARHVTIRAHGVAHKVARIAKRKTKI